MSRQSKQILERLGTQSLARVLDDLLDRKRLVRLANSCGLEYPGMRTVSQKRQRIITDLINRASADQPTRTAIYNVLRKEARATQNAWSSLSAAERQELLGNDKLLLGNGDLSRQLFVLACTGESSETIAALLARHPKHTGDGGSRGSGRAARPSREETRLGKQVAERDNKVLHLETQLAKSKDAQKNAKRELGQRKSELAELRARVDRLRQDLEEARATNSGASATPDDRDLEPALRLLRKLGTEQKKIARHVARLSERPAAAPAPSPNPPLAEALATLHKEIVALRRDRKKELQQFAFGYEELRAELAAQRKAAARPGRARLAKGEQARVAVFIDVQNVYYGARRLKGKLDFDAMLQAAVGDRRLIQATAYVVESKEIDQSGFIALLQHRAIDVRRKTLRVRVDGSKKGDWDMELALDILDSVRHVDVVVLVSGDGDFTSLVKRVKRMGPRVEVIGFPRNTAKSLLEAADSFHPLERKFMIYPPRRKRPASSPRPPRGAPPTVGK